jgi:protein-tyrosine phosphatase
MLLAGRHVRAEIYPIPIPGPGRLSIIARPRGGDWLGDEVTALHQAGVDVVVSLLTWLEVAELELAEEADWCARHGVEYLSLPIEDRGVPASTRDAFELLELLRFRLAEGKHVAIHCRQGIGRSSLIAASLLGLLGQPSEQAFAAIEAARGRPVPDTEEQRAWVVRQSAQ